MKDQKKKSKSKLSDFHELINQLRIHIKLIIIVMWHYATLQMFWREKYDLITEKLRSRKRTGAGFIKGIFQLRGL